MADTVWIPEQMVRKKKTEKTKKSKKTRTKTHASSTTNKSGFSLRYLDLVAPVHGHRGHLYPPYSPSLF
jgi:hypothetical protein